jgi:glycerophosphoryl diester phosphodiesterase
MLGMLVALCCITSAYSQTKIIAHRGFWDKSGSAQNSISSLKNAIELGVYGSEVDVWLTKDNYVIVHHDPYCKGVYLEAATYDRLTGFPLVNGEAMPTLKQYIETAKRQQQTKLIVEIKSMSYDVKSGKPAEAIEQEKRLVAAVVKLVEEYGISDQVDYIAFSPDACRELIRINPKHRVAYLSGDKSPKELKDEGYWGLDYEKGILRKHPEWIKEAKALGLTTNVWTVNKAEDMLYFIDLGVNFITTDNPQLLIGLLTK